MNPNHEILVDYMDKQLGAEATAEVKSLLKQDMTVAEEMEYIQLAVDTVRLEAIRKQVTEGRQTFEENKSNTTKPASGVVRNMYRFSLRIAAIIVLVAGISFLYKYLTVSSESIFKKQFTEYELGTNRGLEKSDNLSEAFQNKNWDMVVSDYQSLSNPSVKMQFLAAQAEMQRSHFPQAISIFENLLAVNKMNRTDSLQDETEFYLSLALLKNHQAVEAIKLMHKIKQDPNHRYYPALSKISSIDLKIIELKKQ